MWQDLLRILKQVQQDTIDFSWNPKQRNLTPCCMIVKNEWVIRSLHLKYFLAVLILCCHRQFQTEFRFKIVSIFLWFKSCYFILNDLWTMRWRCPTYSEIHSSFGRNWDSKQSKRPKVRIIRRIKWVLSTLFYLKYNFLHLQTEFFLHYFCIMFDICTFETWKNHSVDIMA